MKRRRLTVLRLAFRNLSKQRFQTHVLFLLLFITTVTLFFSSYLSRSMSEGLKETKERLGADLIIVPDRFVSSIEDALFIGKPCTVNFDKKWLDKIGAIEGILLVSYQLYISSLSMDCCDSSLQLIAYDNSSDFVISPWLSTKGINTIRDNEIILGCNMQKKVGDTVKYYGRNFTVIDVLHETGMGYDNCAFISYQAAYSIANDPDYEGILPFDKNQKVISMVLAKLEAGKSIAKVKADILREYPDSGIAVYSTSDLVSRFSDNLNKFKMYAGAFKVLFLILAVISLYAIYSLTIHLRKEEFGTFFSFGTGRSMILKMLLIELLILILLASLSGIGFVFLFTIPFHEMLKNALAIPFLIPKRAELLTIGSKTLIVNCLVCIPASIISFYNLAHQEGILLIKSNNA